MNADYAGENLVFVVGCPRSGTTWVQRLLATHPCVRTGQESDIFDLYVGPQLRTWQQELEIDSSGRGGVGLACYFTDSEYRRILKEYLLRLLAPMVGELKPDELFVEKTPSHVLYMSEIHALLPKARFIHVLRDARDTVASLLSASHGWGRMWAPRRAADAARTWIAHVRAAQHAEESLSSAQYMQVRYERLHREGARELRKVADWLQLMWTEDDLRKAFERNSPEAARAGQGTPIPLGGEFGQGGNTFVNEPPGFIRRAAVGGWQQDLNALEKLQVWRVAHATMDEFGYAWKSPWST